MSEVSSENVLNTAFLDTIGGEQISAWFTIKQETRLKVNTGAEVTDISEQSYLSLQKPQLLAPEKILYGPSRQPLKTLGQFWGKFSHSVRVLSLLGLLAKTELFTSGRSFH